MELMGNSQTTTTKFGEYKEVEGLLFPHRTELLMGPQEVVFDTTLIELNPAIDPQTFK
jgi:zinc protease